MRGVVLGGSMNTCDFKEQCPEKHPCFVLYLFQKMYQQIHKLPAPKLG